MTSDQCYYLNHLFTSADYIELFFKHRHIYIKRIVLMLSKRRGGFRIFRNEYICLLEYMLIWVYAYLSICNIWVYAYLSICLLEYILIWVYAYLSICLFEYMLIWVYAYLSICALLFMENDELVSIYINWGQSVIIWKRICFNKNKDLSVWSKLFNYLN